jgi:hypothetical protein
MEFLIFSEATLGQGISAGQGELLGNRGTIVGANVMAE